MSKEKKTFFERLTGTVRISNEEKADPRTGDRSNGLSNGAAKKHFSISSMDEAEADTDIWSPTATAGLTDEEAELAVDVYQTADMIVIRAMIAGVRPEDLDINITRDIVTIKGKREEENLSSDENTFVRELYWGSFSRTISLPEEIDVDESEAIEKHGLLILKLPKLDKKRQSKLRVKTA